MSLNRPGGLERSTVGSMRGSNGSYTPDTSGSDANPYRSGLHGLTDGVDWGDVRLVSNVFRGTTVSPSPPYNDSILLFPGTWGDDYQIVGVVARSGDASAASSQEVELIMCGDLTPHYARLYEVMISVHATNIYADIVRWNGPQNQYDILVHQVAGVPQVLDGYSFKAVKVGNTITSYLDSGGGFTQMASVDITTAPANGYGPVKYTRGLPGMGFFQRGGSSANLLDFGWKSVVITAL